MRARLLLIGVGILFALFFAWLLGRSSGMDAQIDVPPYGKFVIDGSPSDEFVNYVLRRDLRGQTTDYIIYPQADRSRWSGEDRSRVAKRIAHFEDNVEQILPTAVGRIRALALEYGIDLTQVGDEKILGSIKFHNVKFENEGMIETYTDSAVVSGNLDLVFRFDSEMRVVDVYFDG